MWLGVIGACSGSSAAGLSVFRVQIMFGALAEQIRRIHAPHRIAPVRYAGRTVDTDTMDAIVLYLRITSYNVCYTKLLRTSIRWMTSTGICLYW